MRQPTETSDSVEICVGLPERFRVDAARLFYEVFHGQLRALMPTEEIAIQLLPDDLDPERVIIAVVDDNLAGFVGLAYSRRNFMSFTRRDFTRRFGPIGGGFRHFIYRTCARPRLDRDLVVDGLGVAVSMRRRGIGARLIAAVCEFARANGFRAVRLEVAETNEDARRLYERAGFVIVRTRRLPAVLAAAADYAVDIEMCKQLT
jgi:ribosomal protein S18 acetylase RimI-like enzyme